MGGVASRTGGTTQGPADAARQLGRFAPGRGGFETQEVGAPGQVPGGGPGGLAGPAAEGVADHGIAAALPNCVSHLGKDTRKAGVGGHEGGPDGATAGASP
jgi:hypothetical protein